MEETQGKAGFKRGSKYVDNLDLHICFFISFTLIPFLQSFMGSIYHFSSHTYLILDASCVHENHKNCSCDPHVQTVYFNTLCVCFANFKSFGCFKSTVHVLIHNLPHRALKKPLHRPRLITWGKQASLNRP